MDKNDLKFFAVQLGAKIPELDLHGLYPNQALDRLEIFLYQCIEKNIDSARVIYGGGTGRLREVVLERIKQLSIVDDYHDEGGSCVIIF